MRTPSLTKIAITIAVALIIIAGAFAVSKKNSLSQEANLSSLNETVKSAVAKSLTDDTDNDGLKNWEEVLYKTDPNNPDTDGDGISDGDEVKDHSDPAVPGRGNNFQTVDDLKPYASSTPFDDTGMSATDKFSRDIFLKYFEARQSGQNIDDTVANDIADSVIQGNYAPVQEKFITPVKLITQDNSVAALKAYGNTLGKIVSTPRPENTPYEVDIMNVIPTDGLSPQNKISLEAIVSRYREMRKEVAAMVVPSNLIKGHELFIQGLDQIIYGVVGTIKFESDPVGAYIAMNGYGQGLDVMTAAASVMKAEFQKAKVSFSPQEYGSLLTE